MLTDDPPYVIPAVNICPVMLVVPKPVYDPS